MHQIQDNHTDFKDQDSQFDYCFSSKYKYKYKYICIAQNCIMKYSVVLYTVPLVTEFILSIIEFFKQMSFQFEFASETCFIWSFGNAFHHLGPTTAIDLSAVLVLVLGTVNRIFHNLIVYLSVAYNIYRFTTC